LDISDFVVGFPIGKEDAARGVYTKKNRIYGTRTGKNATKTPQFLILFLRLSIPTKARSFLEILFLEPLFPIPMVQSLAISILPTISENLAIFHCRSRHGLGVCRTTRKLALAQATNQKAGLLGLWRWDLWILFQLRCIRCVYREVGIIPSAVDWVMLVGLIDIIHLLYMTVSREFGVYD
jgi:hypothetical protein